MNQFGDLLDQAHLVDLVGNLGDDQALPLSSFLGLHHNFCSQCEKTSPGLVSFLDAAHAVNEPGRWKIGTGNFLHQLGDRHLRVLQQEEQSLDDFGNVVGRDISGIADRNATGAVDQKIRHSGRQDHRFLPRLIIIRDEIDRFLIDVSQHLLSQFGHARFGVAHGRR